jgi:RimJ/RimL family protein N-acetyltransferase
LNTIELIIITERTYLRQLNECDAAHFFLLNSDPEVLQYTGDKAFDSLEESAGFLRNYRQYELFGCGRWAVISKVDDAFLGWCGLRFAPESMEYDLGFRFFKKYWNQGFASETGTAVLKYGFDTFPLDTIIGRVAKANKGSIRVLEKIGFKYAQSTFLHGEEALLYTFSREEWNKRTGTAI